MFDFIVDFTELLFLLIQFTSANSIFFCLIAIFCPHTFIWDRKRCNFLDGSNARMELIVIELKRGHNVDGKYNQKKKINTSFAFLAVNRIMSLCVSIKAPLIKLYHRPVNFQRNKFSPLHPHFPLLLSLFLSFVPHCTIDLQLNKKKILLD